MADNIKTEKDALKLFVLNLEDELGEEFTKMLIFLISKAKTKHALELAVKNYEVKQKRMKIAQDRRDFIEKIKIALVKSLENLFEKLS